MNLDVALFRWINIDLGWDGLAAIMRAASNFRLFIPLVLAAAAWMVLRDGRRGRLTVLALLLVVPITDQVSSHLLKPWIARPRPCRAEAGIEGVETHGARCSGSGSFPSSHAANTAAAAALIASSYPRTRIPAAAVLLLVGWSRIYLGVHYPGDVLGGWAVGGILGWIGVLGRRWAARRTWRRGPSARGT